LFFVFRVLQLRRAADVREGSETILLIISLFFLLLGEKSKKMKWSGSGLKGGRGVLWSCDVV
jgi:hypothetical protein